ncbi:FG-GAP repeat domain-containing protein [Alloyangia mangrovi]|uniref:FG-GAP repeat domain-containing protein n=1 Tax=Alloyangia mangrovi TaxID=1779329 RepID=UPI0021A88C7F|nr:VCBS repeat-containing protein [Alloyangia mangrovi]
MGGFTEVVTGIPTEVTYDTIARGGASFMSADLNGDGLNDFIKVTHAGPDLPDIPQGDWQVPYSFTVTTEVYLNEGNASFSLSETSQETVSLNIQDYAAYDPDLPDNLFKAYAAGDVDGDGDIDYLASSYLGESVYIFENDGTGAFSVQARSYLEQGYSGNEGRLADMNGDGFLDAILLTGYDRNSIYVMVNDGSGQLTDVSSSMPAEAPPGNPQVVDLDLDGDLDVMLTAGGDGRGIYTYLNNGTGQASRGPALIPQGDSSSGVGAAAAADFDGDGDIEMVTAAYMDEDYGAPRGLRLYDIVEGADGLEFEERSYDPTIVGSVYAPADYDGDGDIDLLVQAAGNRMLVNDGTGHFSLSAPIVPGFVTTEYSWVPRVETGIFHSADEFVF